MRLYAFAATALVLLSQAYAACPTPGDASYEAVCTIDNFNCSSGDALSFITIAFMLVTSAIALTFMYSKLREDAAAGIWAKDEAYNLLISVLLCVGILAFFSGSCQIAESYSGMDPFDASQNYLRTLTQANGVNILRDLTYGSINNQLDATYYLYIGFTPFFGNGVAGRANMRAHSALKEFLMDLYIPMLASLNAQLYILQGIQWVASSILLPFAFVMRLVPPTREFGNMLIALFFGLYIVVPTMYAMSGKVFLEITDETQPWDCVACNDIFHSYGLDSEMGKGTTFYRIGSTIPQAVFLPNLVIIVTVTCVMSLSKALRAIAV